MSNTLYAKVRIKVRVCGLFLLLDPNTNTLLSFFSEKNSSEVTSSKGWMSFFLVNFWASGRRRE
jgi:hypothetical protein